MRNNFSKSARAYCIRPLFTAIFAFAIILTLSCSLGDDDGGGSGDGRTYTYRLKNVTSSSFTIVYEGYECREDGVFEKYEEDDGATNYSINGKTLSLWGLNFNGNSASLTGTWTREPFSAFCNKNDYCEDYDGVSKVVFTQNSLTLTECIGKVGEASVDEDEGITIKRRIIDCGTREYIYTKGNQTVKRVRYYSATPYKQVYTYNGKTCTYTTPSESQRRTACTQAYNKAKSEGYNGSGYLVEDYYYEILEKDIDNCIKNNFPEWYYNR